MTTNEKALAPGSILQGQYTYHIESVMGCGSFGITYKAYTVTETEVELKGALGNLSSKREERVYVAIKEFFMSDFTGRNTQSGCITGTSDATLIGQYRQKFKREAECLSRLHHPNIVRVVEVFEANDTVYYVMEFLEGGSLEQRINNSVALDERFALGLMQQVGSAIDYLHKHRLLHLDLKPGNVMLTSSGKAVLIDFGLSKQYDANGAPEASTTIGGGTPGYSPIEQMSVRDFSPTLDIYALAATLFKCVTGQRPKEAAILLSEGFPEQLLTAAGVSAGTIAAIREGMSPVPAKRPQTVCAMLNALGLDGAKVDKDNRQLLQLEQDLDTDDKSGPVSQPAQNTTEAMSSTPVPPPSEAAASQPDKMPPTPMNAARKPKSKALPIAIAICVGVAAFVGVFFAIGWLDGRNDGKIKQKDIEPEPAQAANYEVKDSAVSIKREGEGPLEYDYTGEVNGNTKLPEGKGRAVYIDGTETTVYEGYFKEGSCNGEATIKFANGDTFKGVVVNDIINKGRYTVKATGYYFEGTFDEQGNPQKGTWCDAKGNVLQTL